MAKISYSSLVNAISGKVGPLVFTAGDAIPTVRLRPNCVYKPSAANFARHNDLRRALIYWRRLTPTQKAELEVTRTHYPQTDRLGNEYYFNAFEFFMWIQLNFLKILPPGEVTTDFNELLIEVDYEKEIKDGDNITISIPAGPLPLNWTTVIYFAYPQSNGRASSFAGPKLQTEVNEEIDATGVNVFSNYGERFGIDRLPSNTYIHLSLQAVHKIYGIATPFYNSILHFS